jgi:dTDP-4-dehydrorhamnose 3,5-epimerase
VRFTETALSGAWLLELERAEDERGFFARAWCADEFEKRGLDSHIAQCNISWNRKRGTLRGMHFQAMPHQESKIVRCIRGGIYDVIVDLRPDSPTFRSWISVELTAESRIALYIPKEFAHGFQTLTDDAEVFYQMSSAYAPVHAKGIRWNDSRLKIAWPLRDPILSERDRSYPDFE